MIENNVNIGAKSFEIKSDISQKKVAKEKGQNINRNSNKDYMDIQQTNTKEVQADIVVQNSLSFKYAESSIIGKILENIFDSKFDIELFEKIENTTLEKLEMKVFEINSATIKAEGIITTGYDNELEFELKYKIVNKHSDNFDKINNKLNIVPDLDINEIHSKINFYAKQIDIKDKNNNHTKMELIGQAKFSNISGNKTNINRNGIINLYLTPINNNKIDNIF